MQTLYFWMIIISGFEGWCTLARELGKTFGWLWIKGAGQGHKNLMLTLDSIETVSQVRKHSWMTSHKYGEGAHTFVTHFSHICHTLHRSVSQYPFKCNRGGGGVKISNLGDVIYSWSLFVRIHLNVLCCPGVKGPEFNVLVDFLHQIIFKLKL